MNTINTGTYSDVWRTKYFSKNLQSVLRKALVCEKICQVDTSNSKYITNPYTTQPTAAIATIAGTYSVSAWSTTEDALTVTDQVTYAGHVYDFEQFLSEFDIMAARMDEMAYAVAWGVDYFVLNNLLDDGTGTYETPAGGFTTAANIPIIFSNIISKVAGYAEIYKGLFVVVENTDLTGIIQAGAASGFSYADAVLNNGLIGNYMGVDIYVVRSGTFVSDTIGTTTVVCSGHRVAGVKGVATYCTPGGAHYEEKSVTSKTGREIAAWLYVGFKMWTQKAGLIIDITLA